MKKLLLLITVLWMVGLTVNAQNPGVNGKPVYCPGDSAHFFVTDDAAAEYHSWMIYNITTNKIVLPFYSTEVYVGEDVGYKIPFNGTGNYLAILTSYYPWGDTVSIAVIFYVLPHPEVEFTSTCSTGVCCSAILTPSGVDYYWLYDGETEVASGTGPFIVDTSGLYKIVGYDDNGCVDASGQFQIEVENQNAVLTASYSGLLDQPVPGNTLELTCGNKATFNLEQNLTPTNFGITSITEWNNGVSGVSSGEVVSGQNLVATTVSSNSCMYQDTVTFVALDLKPKIKVKGTAQKPKLIAKFSDPAAVGYQWNLNGQSIPGATTKTYKVKSSGDYTVTMWKVDVFGCGGTSKKVKIVLPEEKVTTVPDEEKEIFEVYPNPASTYVTIKGVGNQEKISLLDSSGRILHQIIGEGNFSIADVPSGVYFIWDGSEIKKLIIQH